MGLGVAVLVRSFVLAIGPALAAARTGPAPAASGGVAGAPPVQWLTHSGAAAVPVRLGAWGLVPCCCVPLALSP